MHWDREGEHCIWHNFLTPSFSRFWLIDLWMIGQQQTPTFASLPPQENVKSCLALLHLCFISMSGLSASGSMLHISKYPEQKSSHFSGSLFSKILASQMLVSLAILQCIQANDAFYPTLLIISGGTWLCYKWLYYNPTWQCCASSNFKYNE